MIIYSVAVAATVTFSVAIAATAAADAFQTIAPTAIVSGAIEHTRKPISIRVESVRGNTSIRHITNVLAAPQYHVVASSKMIIARSVGAGSFVLFFLFLLLAVFGVINYAIWLPALPALIGICAMTGGHIERIKQPI